MSETVLKWALSKEVNTFVEQNKVAHMHSYLAFCFMTVTNKPLETDTWIWQRQRSLTYTHTVCEILFISVSMYCVTKTARTALYFGNAI